MIEISRVSVSGWDAAIRGMRNPMNSWDKSDSGYCEDIHADDCDKRCGCYHEYRKFCVGPNDIALMKRLVAAGTDHSKFMRFITVTMDVVAPRYWWSEYDTYKIGTVANSCSTMHKIHDKPLFLSDFSHEHLEKSSIEALEHVIAYINDARDDFIASKAERDEDWARHYWWQMIQLLPQSYNQRRTIMLNYQVLRNIYHARRNHKLDEWHQFCERIERLPHSELITERG